jgi:hypothetical protein
VLDVLLELAEEEDLKLMLQVYMDSAPAGVGEKYPDWLSACAPPTSRSTRLSRLITGLAFAAIFPTVLGIVGNRFQSTLGRSSACCLRSRCAVA